MAVEDTPPPPPPFQPIKSSFLVSLTSLGLKSYVETDSASTNPEWCQLDDLIKMWNLGSLCDSLQEQVVTTPGNAKALWDHLKNLFHDNKDARAINLDNELCSIKIGNMTVNEYCTKIQAMANRLKNLDSEVSEKNIMMFAVNGLDSRFATLSEIIRHHEPLPTFETGSQVTYLLLYVDDIIFMASSTTLLQQLIGSLHREFDMTDLGELNYFLGISAVRHSTVVYGESQKWVWTGLPVPRSLTFAEAEYRVFAKHFGRDFMASYLLRELHSLLFTATLIYCNNIDIHFVHDIVTVGTVRVLHVPSRFQYANIFTKGLPSALFEEFCSSLSIWPPPAPTARAY
ncbi:hybrid signal transduction histidine kinase M [Tanacetum coccineum]|uniref:Hybrid signal transduction histidine kinase M n=1 Tax=Tanacetum coccineum TaxID=301880 RepID=A0ABQ5I2R8_9ASTR